MTRTTESQISLRTRLFFLLFAALVATLFLAVPEGDARADDREKAKAYFMEGVEFFSQEKLPEALAAFEESYEVRPKNSVLFNIGMCQKALFRYVESIYTFREYLEKGKGKIKRSHRKKVEAALTEMEKLVGHLAVVGAPEGAEITLDGDSVGIAPLSEPMMLDPGLHSVRVEKDGFNTLRTEVTIASDATVHLKADLSLKQARLKIDCQFDVEEEDPSGRDAFVYTDGKASGGCPYDGEVPAGKLQIVIKAPGMEDYLTVVEIDSGSTMTVSAVLKPLHARDPGPAPVEHGPALLATGIASLVVGVGAGVMGGYFNYKGSQDFYDLGQAADAGNTQRYNSLKDDLGTDKAMMAVGYAAAGVFIVTGAVLLAVDAKNKRSEAPVEKSSVRVVPTGGGVAVSF